MVWKSSSADDCSCAELSSGSCAGAVSVLISSSSVGAGADRLFVSFADNSVGVGTDCAPSLLATCFLAGQGIVRKFPLSESAKILRHYPEGQTTLSDPPSLSSRVGITIRKFIT